MMTKHEAELEAARNGIEAAIELAKAKAKEAAQAKEALWFIEENYYRLLDHKESVLRWKIAFFIALATVLALILALAIT